MTYRVVWRGRSFDYLSVLHFMTLETFGNATALEGAWNRIELALTDKPNEIGESREGNERVLIVNPLTVLYEVFPEQQTVMIYRLVHHEYRTGQG